MTYEITVMVRYSGVVLPTLDYLSQNHPYNNFRVYSFIIFFSVVPAPLVVLSRVKGFSLYMFLKHIILKFNVESSWYSLWLNWGKFIVTNYPHQKKINTVHNRFTLDLSFWVIDYWNLWLRHWKVRCQKKKCKELWHGPTYNKL